ncbi:hypothetical protein ACLJYM_26330 [Rhizobium giardinii]|uniref:hypothetical protein n=1 Tax=Rhizobium giardinii TaxID=56731 RepID=UPI0039E1A4FD
MQRHSDRTSMISSRSPKTSSKKLVRASLLDLTDPDLKDRKILTTIYALTIKHRLDEVRADEIGISTTKSRGSWRRRCLACRRLRRGFDHVMNAARSCWCHAWHI